MKKIIQRMKTSRKTPRNIRTRPYNKASARNETRMELHLASQPETTSIRKRNVVGNVKFSPIRVKPERSNARMALTAKLKPTVPSVRSIRSEAGHPITLTARPEPTRPQVSFFVRPANRKPQLRP
ncbi:MAG: hypothetical protein HY544_04975 [Candidatus Diapherotrites archaeon]|uniref:Uncharacterized protein n=1 Tax=Candidatus Iainarchaeum sp. TaxID=3101447 RepID=A0A8T3YM85_9ARCH|nr:hypothetical protein [Candidatus Diapherotrites archaeon]